MTEIRFPPGPHPLDGYGVVVDDDGSAVVMTAENDDTVVLSRWSP